MSAFIGFSTADVRESRGIPLRSLEVFAAGSFDATSLS
jgi:hypothetical protein